MGLGLRTRWGAVALAGALLGGCVSGSDGDKSGDDQPQVHGSKDGVQAAAQAIAALRRADSCDDLLGRIQGDVVTKIALQAELMRDGDNAVSNNYPTRGGVAVGPAFGSPGVALPPMASAGAPGAAEGDFANNGGSASAPLPSTPTTPAMNPSSTPTDTAMRPSSGTGADDKGTLGPNDYSKTNNQVEGVDEADIVKTDGTHIYLLHGNQLFVLDSWPADETAMRDSITIEGTTSEMFVKDGIAVVFSALYDQGDLIEPKVDAASGAISSPYYSWPFTKITVVDVTGAPKVQRQLLIEGTYLSARLHDTTVRAVIEGGFRTPSLYAANIEYIDPWGRKYDQQEIDSQVDAWRDRMVAAVQATELADWLPAEREIINGTLGEPSRRCTDFYAPSPGLANYGLTNVVSFDMTDPKSALGGAIVLGASDEVYANDTSLVLASRDYRFDTGFIQKERTVLHMFALDGADTSYVASGAVPGHIVDQFSIDELDGVLRVATSTRFWQTWVAPLPELAQAVADQDDDEEQVAKLQRTTDNRVLTLREKDGALARVGATEPLGHDGEQIMSTRFIGDVGYVVTFRQKDPLIVVDLHDAAKPAVLGELEIPGFSDYMHPLGPDHLLTIGRSADASGSDQGLQLQIFDVSDPTAPKRTSSYRFSDGGYSEANVDHKAFTFHTPAGTPEGEGLLAFPYVSYSGQSSSSLELFHVSASDGFKKLGSINHTNMLQNLCSAVNGVKPVPVDIQQPGIDPGFAQPIYFDCVPPQVRRGLFIFGNEGDFVYSISLGGVLVHDMTDLVTPVASVALPYPDYSDHRAYYGTTGGVRPAMSSGGGSVGAATPTVMPPVSTTPASPPSEPAPTPKPEG